MTVKEQLKIDLLKYPVFIKNKWECYNQWFNTCGDCMKWENGELIDVNDGDDEMSDIVDLASAFDYFFEQFADSAVEDSSTFAGELFDAPNQFAAMESLEKNEEHMRHEFNNLKNITKMLSAIKYRMVDFERKDEFSPLTEKSIIANLPENGINDDWKNACKEYYKWLLDHFNELDVTSQNIVNNIKTSWLHD